MIDTEISKDNIVRNRDTLINNVVMKCQGSAEALAGPMVFLTSEQAGYISGFELEVTGGSLLYRIRNSRGTKNGSKNMIEKVKNG